MNFLLCGVVAALLFVGCSSKPAALLEKALRAETQAKQAFEKHDVEGAEMAAARAEVALADFEELSKAGKVSEEQKSDLRKRIVEATRSARNYAQLAVEEQQRTRKLASLKLQVYQRTRDAVRTYGLEGLAAAAGQLAKTGSNSCPEAERRIASGAWNLLMLVQPKQFSTNAEPDWAGMAATLRTWESNPPPAAAMVLALGFVAGGMTDLGLSEMLSVNPLEITNTNERSVYHLERCALYALQGWDRSAAREMDETVRLSPEGWKGMATTKAVGAFHFWLADHALDRSHFAQADADMEEAVKAWPESPLASLLAGEQLNAHGQWEKAVAFLETQAASVKDDWFAKQLSRRASELRQTEGKAGPLFANTGFLMELAGHALNQAGTESDTVRKLLDYIGQAKGFWMAAAEKFSMFDSKSNSPSQGGGENTTVHP
jgi:hypothetical protein